MDMKIKSSFDPRCITYSQMNLIVNSRIYYRRLTTWTRAYILSKYYGIGTEEELFGRLYLESLDIGKMMQIVFGREISEQYSQFLSQFPIALRDLLNAQTEGDMEAVARNIDRLYQNVAERAVFLEEINPYWSEAEYIELFSTYIQLILEVANALAARDFNKGMELYDRLTAHSNRMGDVFAQGLYEYITSGQQAAEPLSPQQCITFDQMNTIYYIRMFWFELVIWIREYMLSRYLNLGDADEIYAWLNQVTADFVNNMKQIFVEIDTAEYLQLFRDYLGLIDALITAQIEGNIDEMSRITQSLYQNADERAAFVASINPFWNEDDARVRLYNNLRSTIEESTTFLTGDYARNIDIFSRLLDQAESTSNFLAQGAFEYLTGREM